MLHDSPRSMTWRFGVGLERRDVVGRDRLGQVDVTGLERVELAAWSAIRLEHDLVEVRRCASAFQ